MYPNWSYFSISPQLKRWWHRCDVIHNDRNRRGKINSITFNSWKYNIFLSLLFLLSLLSYLYFSSYFYFSSYPLILTLPLIFPLPLILTLPLISTFFAIPQDGSLWLHKMSLKWWEALLAFKRISGLHESEWSRGRQGSKLSNEEKRRSSMCCEHQGMRLWWCHSCSFTTLIHWLSLYL